MTIGILFDADIRNGGSYQMSINNLVLLKELYLGTNPWVSFPESLKPLLEKMLYGQSDVVKKLLTTPQVQKPQ
jgi:hypothetical protein